MKEIIKQIIKKPSFLLFIASALLVAVLEGLQGNLICTLWALLAGCFCFTTHMAEVVLDNSDELLSAVMDEFQEICNDNAAKDAEIAALKDEITRLKYKKNE